MLVPVLVNQQSINQSLSQIMTWMMQHEAKGEFLEGKKTENGNEANTDGN